MAVGNVMKKGSALIGGDRRVFL